jgi:hypothetical protein
VGFIERSGAIDFFGGETKFFLDGELGGDAAAGFDFAETTRDEALELLLRLTPGDYEAVEFFVNTGLDQERGFDERWVAHTTPLPFVELAEDDFRNARVDDGVEAVEPGAVVEDDGAKFCPVNAAIRGDHCLAEFLEDPIVGWLAWLDEFVGNGVSVEDGETHFAEHGGDGAFAAGDSTGEAESEHFSLITALKRSIELRRIWARRDGGARL